MSAVWSGLFVFVAMAVADYLWARYILATADRQAFTAALWSAGIALVNGSVVLAYVSHPWLIPIAGAGAFAGTLISIKRTKPKSKEPKP